jgi:hypothetical protein
LVRAIGLGKNELLKPGMFMIRMPSNANPRMMSSVAMRSLIGSEPIVGVAIGLPLPAA